MSESLSARITQSEAQMINRLVNAWSAAQTVVESLEPALRVFGLLKPSGALNTDRVLEINKRARDA